MPYYESMPRPRSGAKSSEGQLNLFHMDDDRPSFELLGQTNGGKFWYARDFMRMLGYESYQAFQKPINKAIATCTALNIPVVENFEQVRRVVDGEAIQDIKLTRFACYLVAVNGDVKKPQVAAAQAYFVTMAEAFRQFIQGADEVERVQIREEGSERCCLRRRRRALCFLPKRRLPGNVQHGPKAAA